MQDSADTQQDLAPAAASPGPGTVLKEAREHLAMSVSDVARMLRLSPRQVEAIEADEYHRLPGGPFVRGFVGNYARLLQLDPKPLLESLEGYAPNPERFQLAPESKEIPFPTERKRSWSRVVALGALLLLAAGLLVFEGYRTYLPQAMEAASPPPEPVAQPLPKPEPEPVITVQPVPLPTPAPVLEAVPPPAAAEPAASPAAEALPATSGRIRLEFQGESWAEIRDSDGKTIYSQISREGATRTVEGKPPLSLVIGNASLVKVYFNGAAVDLAPHSRAGVARITLQ
jgi:cytoskeleton protein RodZ